MAWTYEESFEGFSNAALNGQDGWAGSTSYVVQASVASAGTKAVALSGNLGSVSIAKELPGGAVTAGGMYIRMRRTVNDSGLSFTILGNDDGTANWAFMRLNASGQAHAFVGAAYRLLGTYAVDTWVTFNAEWDIVAHPNEWRCAFHDGTSWGSFSIWGTVNGGSLPIGFTGMEFDCDDYLTASGTTYWDQISASDPTAGGGGGGNPWNYYSQQRKQVRKRFWQMNGLLWTPSYAFGKVA